MAGRLSLNKALFPVLLLGVAAAIGGRFWYIADNRADQDQGKPPVPVLLTRADTRDMPVLLEAIGRAEAYASVTLKSRLDGQVATVEYAAGRHVGKGEALLRLDPAEFAARLRQAEANLARDQTLLAKTRADLARYRALREQGFVAEERVEETRTAALAAEAAVKAGEAAVDLARLQLSYTVIRAPFDGVVGERLVFPGTAVKVNDSPLAVINRVRPLYVGFAVPEKYLPQLRDTLRTAPLGVTLRVPGDGDHAYQGKADFLDNAVDTATGTIQMKATLANDDERLTPGQYLNVSLRLDTLHDVVTVPAEAVQQGPEGSFVFIVQADKTAQARPVRVALVYRGRAALSEGLAAGEMVVADGHSRLTPGAKVNPKEAKAAGTRSGR